MEHLKPGEILEATIQIGITKAKSSTNRLILLSLMAGVFIALAGAGANMAGYYFLSDPLTNGLGRMLSGLIFPVGLIMVSLAGSELFTGNNLMLSAVLDKKITVRSMLRNWIIVYIGNFIGSVLIAWMVAESGLLETGGGLLGIVTINIAVAKTSLGLGPVLARAMMCNFLVCIAVWMSNGSKSTIGKIFCIFFPIFLFVAAGFEHSIANMFFIPVALFADGGATAGLTWGGFLLHNLLPVTIGNIIGGSFFVAGTYFCAYKKA